MSGAENETAPGPWTRRGFIAAAGSTLAAGGSLLSAAEGEASMVREAGRAGTAAGSAARYTVCQVRGSAWERGEAYGEWLGERLQRFHDQEIYQAMEAHHKLGRGAINAYAEACLPHIRRDAPRAWAFMEGLSAASGMGLTELAALLAHEEYYHGEPVSHHCTGFAAGPRETRDGQTYIGQTWDWMKSTLPYRHVLRQTTEKGQRILTYAFPGLWSGAGVSSAGVGFVWVGAGYAHASRHGGKARAGVPSYALIAELLEQPSFDAAVDSVMKARHAGWFYFLLAGKQGQLARIEATPTQKVCLRPPSLMAAQYPYATEALRREAREESYGALPPHGPKYARMCELLMSHSGRLDRDTFLAFTRDHVPNDESASICCGHEGSGGTLDGFVFSPSLLKAWFIPGPPCRNEVQEFEV